MKKLLTCFLAIMVYAPAVFGADGAISRIIPSDSGSSSNSSSARTTTNTSRTTASRAIPTQTPDVSKSATNVRSTVSRVFSGAPEKNIKASAPRTGVVSRATVGRFNEERSALDAAVNTVGRNSRVSAASINSNPAVRRAGLVLRPSTAEVGGRALIGDTGMQTGSNIDESIRKIRGRSAVVNAETLEETRTRLEQTAELNKTCQDQYNECMDQFCAVIDANQKRCSCSANLKQYAKVEEAVKSANTQLNEIAQRIRYVGLSADEISAIMTETEAEEALSGTTDTSETRSMLDEIEELIRDPKTSSSSYSSNSSFGGINLDLDFSGDTADIFNLDFLNNDNSTSFSNLRGTDLYNAAKKRCTSVLNQCKDAGATSNQITGNYDLAIDKDCIAYEQGLIKMNDTLKSNVRSANMMLQKARLAVLQNKNQYDAKGCIAALNTCMTDDMVCGTDYFKCVDPTKRYIDENGEVVLGQDISQITAFMTDYNNAGINQGFLSNAADMEINADSCSGTDGKNGSCVAAYLLSKIGTGQKLTDGGLCRAVLDKCQTYTYSADGTYNPYNDIVVNYVQRAMVNIRAAQQQIISDYASSCMVDIANCYNQQVSQLNSWSSSNSVNGIYKVMRGACRNVALTCGYAIFDGDTNVCPGGDKSKCTDNYITEISEMFYQSMLCDDGEVFDKGLGYCVKNTLVYDLNGIATWTDKNAQTEKVSVGTTVYLMTDQKFNNVVELDSDYANESNVLYWCYDNTGAGLTCAQLNNPTNSFKTSEYFLNKGGKVYLSIAGTERVCIDDMGGEWDSVSGCICPSGRTYDGSKCVAPPSSDEETTESAESTETQSL